MKFADTVKVGGKYTLTEERPQFVVTQYVTITEVADNGVWFEVDDVKVELSQVRDDVEWLGAAHLSRLVKR